MLPPDGADEARARRRRQRADPHDRHGRRRHGQPATRRDRGRDAGRRRRRSTTSRSCCTPAAAPAGPSACRSTHANLSISAQNVARSYALDPDDVSLCVMPLFHVHGLVASTLATLATGGTVVVPAKFSPLSFWRVARDHGVTWYSAVPTMHQLLLRARRSGDPRRPAGAEQLRFIRSCSASLPPQVMHALEAAFGAPVLEAYGMTEAAHQMASNPLPPAARKPGSVGRGTDVQISIMDAAGQPPADRRARRGRHQGPERHHAATRTIPRRTRRRSSTAGSAPAIRASSTRDGYLTLVGAHQGADQPRRREDLAARDRRSAARRIRRSPKRSASACRTDVGRRSRGGRRRCARRSTEAELLAFCKERLADFKRPEADPHHRDDSAHRDRQDSARRRREGVSRGSAS